MQIQSMIVEDINDEKIVCTGMSVDKLVTKYAEYLSTLNAGQSVNKANSQKEICSYCGRTGHAAIDCHKRLRDEGKLRKSKDRPTRNAGTNTPRGPQEWHKTATCHGCGEIGHIKPFCPDKNKTDGKTGEGDSPVPVSSAQIKELTSHMEENSHNAGYIATVCEPNPALLNQPDQVCGTRPHHEGPSS